MASEGRPEASREEEEDRAQGNSSHLKVRVVIKTACDPDHVLQSAFAFVSEDVESGVRTLLMVSDIMLALPSAPPRPPTLSVPLPMSPCFVAAGLMSRSAHIRPVFQPSVDRVQILHLVNTNRPRR